MAPVNATVFAGVVSVPIFLAEIVVPVTLICSAEVTVISVSVTVPAPPVVIVMLAPSAAADIPPPVKVIFS